MLRAPVAFYVTTPIYYVNAEPHLGHAYSTIAADVLARHHRQRGEDVFFLTGTDEHGEPVALAAEREGVTPQELVDRNAPRFRELVEKFDASNDFFIRTTDPEHMAKVQEVVQRVYDNGHVYEGLYEGWYCPRCADFKTESEIGPDNTCPIHEIPLDWESQQNWFFRLSAFQEDLERLYEERPGFVEPSFRRNEALSFIKGGLQDVSLSRPKLSWGVPLPWDDEQVIYVWFDALLNYYTALSYAREGEDLTERFWPATLHVIGKDILKFHTVYWPAFLIAAGIELPGARLRPRLPADGREEDVEVARQRARPVRGDRPLRRRRAALLLLPRGLLRPGRQRLDGRLRVALRDRARQRLGQPRQPDAGDDRALPRRRRPRRAEDPALAEGDDALEGIDGVVRRPARPHRAERRRWRRSGRGSGGSTATSRRTSPGSWPRTSRESGRVSSTGCRSTTSPRGVRVLALTLHPYMPETSGRLLDALAEGNRELDAFGARAGGQRVERIEPLFPKLD